MRFRWVPLITLTCCALLSNRALAHGASVQYRATQAIAIRAAFDSGEPMAEAQVTVFSPDSPTKPWLQGKTNANGQFSFVPDISHSGNWEVQVRQAGHGTVISIPEEAISSLLSDEVESSSLASAWISNGQDFSPTQILLMAAAGVWGCIGTACYFTRKG